MNSGADHHQADHREALAALAGRPRSPEAEVDLDRLVWDPEYRNSVRHLFGPKG